MNDQDPTTTPATPNTGNPPSTPATPTSDPVVAPAGTNSNIAVGTIDLSAYFKDGEPGVYDPDKIAALVKERDTKAKSASYFQSQFMQKNEVPATVEGYAEHFKPDSVYESLMDKQEVKDTIQAIREFGLKEGLSPRAVNAFIDFSLKQAVANNEFDMRTPEQIKAESDKATAAEKEKLTPFLESTHRTFEEQTELLNKFFDAPSVFTNDAEVKEFLQKAATESATGYKIVSYLIDAIEFGGYKALPSQGDSLGIGANEFWSKYNAESDPVKREAMLTQFEQQNPQK